jgi:hypothetical protein
MTLISFKVNSCISSIKAAEKSDSSGNSMEEKPG